MKHLIAGVLILVLVLTLSVVAVQLLDHRTGQVLQELRLAQQATMEENFPNTRDCVANAQDLWQRHTGFYGVILPQRQTEEIDRHFARLLAASQTGDAAEVRITCDELIFLLDHLGDMERGHYFNVL